MSTWLKKFEETAFGMLFQDQYLSPSEVVKIAQQTQAAGKARRCGTSACDVGTAGEQAQAPATAALGGHRDDVRLSAAR